MQDDSEYLAAKRTLEFIAQMKREHKELLLRQINTPLAKEMWLAARDVDSAVEGMDEDIDEMCWQAVRQAKKAIQDHDTQERLEHEYSERTHYVARHA